MLNAAWPPLAQMSRIVGTSWTWIPTLPPIVAQEPRRRGHHLQTAALALSRYQIPSLLRALNATICTSRAPAITAPASTAAKRPRKAPLASASTMHVGTRKHRQHLRMENRSAAQRYQRAVAVGQRNRVLLGVQFLATRTRWTLHAMGKVCFLRRISTPLSISNI